VVDSDSTARNQCSPTLAIIHSNLFSVRVATVWPSNDGMPIEIEQEQILDALVGHRLCSGLEHWSDPCLKA
jgi:hypothetical protein